MVGGKRKSTEQGSKGAKESDTANESDTPGDKLVVGGKRKATEQGSQGGKKKKNKKARKTTKQEAAGSTTTQEKTTYDWDQLKEAAAGRWMERFPMADTRWCLQQLQTVEAYGEMIPDFDEDLDRSQLRSLVVDLVNADETIRNLVLSATSGKHFLEGIKSVVNDLSK